DYDEEGIFLFAHEPETHQQYVIRVEETYVKIA
ncbi:ferredoxin, partial [Enterococcus faecium]